MAIDMNKFDLRQRTVLDTVLRDYYQEVEGDIKPNMSADSSDELLKIIVTQNVLRACLESTLNAAAPHSEQLLAELAVRIASYIISAAPDNLQKPLIDAVAAALPGAHAKRLEQGVRINARWA